MRPEDARGLIVGFGVTEDHRSDFARATRPRRDAFNIICGRKIRPSEQWQVAHVEVVKAPIAAR